MRRKAARKAARRDASLVYAAVGASVLAIPATAAAVAPASTPSGSPSSAPSGSPAPIKARVKRRRIGYGQDAVVIGRAPSSDDGQTVDLEFSPTSTNSWRQVASGRVGGNGSFRLVAALKRSGRLRATTPPSASAALFPLGDGTTSGSSDPSTPQRVTVAAALRVHPRSIDEFSERTLSLRGELLPGTAWRQVRLLGDRSGRWVTLARARTNKHGAFDLRYRPGGPGQEQLQVRFAGDSGNSSVSANAGRLTVYRQSVASWYDDAGSTACGFHAYYGVANLSLPCGSKVNFRYDGRSVEAVVDDRGPYVGGRTWDLNQNTAAALGFGGVGSVWSSS